MNLEQQSENKGVPITNLERLEKLQRQNRYRINLRRHYQEQLKNRIRDKRMIVFNASMMFQDGYEFGRNGE